MFPRRRLRLRELEPRTVFYSDHGLWVPPWVQVSPQANPTSCSQLAALRPKGSPESLQGAPSLSSRRTLPSKEEWGVEVGS